MAPDPKPPRRIVDKKLLADMHLQGVLCVFSGQPGSLHHILSKGQGGDDVRANLIGLSGDGTSGYHGLIEAEDLSIRRKLGKYIVENRPDTVAYLKMKLGEEEAKSWMWRRLLTPM